MSKSMYSLILMDEVVQAIDRQAYRHGTSRSNLINQILAQHLQLVTPEQYIEDIFRSIAQIADNDNALQIPSKPSGTMLQVKSVLRYKYNPTIRYTVELSYQDSVYHGVFRVLSRTQSGALKEWLAGFFDLWAQLEHLCYAKAGLPDPVFEISDGRYSRTLRLPDSAQADSKALGEHIGDYIQLFDRALEQYFLAGHPIGPQDYQQLYTLYESYLAKTGLYL